MNKNKLNSRQSSYKKRGYDLIDTPSQIIDSVYLNRENSLIEIVFATGYVMCVQKDFFDEKRLFTKIKKKK